MDFICYIDYKEYINVHLSVDKVCEGKNLTNIDFRTFNHKIFLTQILSHHNGRIWNFRNYSTSRNLLNNYKNIFTISFHF